MNTTEKAERYDRHKQAVNRAMKKQYALRQRCKDFMAEHHPEEYARIRAEVWKEHESHTTEETQDGHNQAGSVAC